MRTTFIAAILALTFGLLVGHVWTERKWEARWAERDAAESKASEAVVKDAGKKLTAQYNAGQTASRKATATDQKVQEQIRAVIKEVPKHVTPDTDRRTCVPYGFVRTLDAAVLGVRPGDLPLPAGKSDDDCAPIEASSLAAGIAENYGAARQNAVQLDALLDYLGDQELILSSNGEPPHAD